MTPIHQFGEFLRTNLQAVPLSAVRVLFVGSLAVILIWVMVLPRSRTTPPAGCDGANLKTGAAAALTIQVLIYMFL